MYNIELFHFFNNLGYAHAWVGKTALFVATTFSILFFIGTVVYLIMRPYPGYENKPLGRFGVRFRELFFVLFTSGIAWLICSMLKELFHHPRPFISVPDLHLLLVHGGYDSFPSNHATFFAALATSMFFVDKKLGAIYATLAIIIGISRIIIGVHFPIDIVVGWLLGVVVAFVISRVKNKVRSLA